MGGGKNDETEDTTTIREFGLTTSRGYSAKAKSRSAKKIKYYSKVAKVHHRKVKAKKEETGKEILARIIRELNANIRRKERAQEIRRK